MVMKKYFKAGELTDIGVVVIFARYRDQRINRLLGI